MLDIRLRNDVTALARRTRPEVVINAAYRQSDWKATADGGMHVALAAAAAGARLVHVSSDAVFSGAAPATTNEPARSRDALRRRQGSSGDRGQGHHPAAVIARTC